VAVIKEFVSDNDAPTTLKKGWRGRVREVDTDGDAYIKFDNHEVGQMVFKENFANLKVEATFESEAFKGNWMNAFDELDERSELPTGTKPRVFRGEQLQLANRLFVEEALGLCTVAEERLRIVGELLLCPLLLDAARGLVAVGVEFEEIQERRQWLRYVASQVEEPHELRAEPPTVAAWQKSMKQFHARRLPYDREWFKTRAAIAAQLSEVSAGVARLGELTRFADVTLGEDGSITKSTREIPQQSSVLPPDMVIWLQRKDTTRAFIELRRCGAVINADDFNLAIKGMAARSPKYFSEHFWRGTFYLLLWGRAKHLQTFLLKELRRRLPDGVVLNGPSLRPREDYLLQIERKASEDAIQKRREEGHWLAWDECFRLRKMAIGKLYDEAEAYKVQSKIMDPKTARHLRTWGSVPWLEEPSKPNAAAEGLASGTGAPAARMLKTKAPVAVDKSLLESRAATGKDDLPTGLTDVLKVQVVCDTVEVFREAFAALLRPPEPPPKAVPQPAQSIAEMSDGDGEARFGHVVSFRALRIVNDFHKDMASAVYPRAARLLVIACLSVMPRGVGAVPVQQLVQIEVLLPSTMEAQWLIEYLQLDPSEFAPERQLGLAEPS